MIPGLSGPLMAQSLAGAFVVDMGIQLVGRGLPSFPFPLNLSRV
jgi:hypothetical protein